MDDYMSFDAVGLAALVRSGSAQPADLLAAARARADEVNPLLNAIVRAVDTTPDPKDAEAQPFYGVPFLIKDLHQDLAGYPTSGGSRSLSAVPARETSTWCSGGSMLD